MNGRPEVPETPGRPAASLHRYYWHRQDVLLLDSARRSGDETANSSCRILNVALPASHRPVRCKAPAKLVRSTVGASQPLGRVQIEDDLLGLRACPEPRDTAEETMSLVWMRRSIVLTGAAISLRLLKSGSVVCAMQICRRRLETRRNRTHPNR